MRTFTRLLTLCLAALSTAAVSQNEVKKWCFGGYAGLDFMTTPPTIFTHTMYTSEACSSIADSAGNLLFYTNAVSVWDKTNSIMANGSGLQGHTSTTQGALIIKKPQSYTEYYLFTLNQLGAANGFRYSIIDMSLAAGMGSVTAKNVLINTPPSTEKLTASLHCNKKDVWVLTHDLNTNVFRAHLLTASGLGSPVTSSVGVAHTGTAQAVPIGQMKISPNGKKVGVVIHGGVNQVQVFDFDNATGIVSNPLTLNNNLRGYGCEFSPDGSKFYTTVCEQSPAYLYQFDLCASNPPASQTTLFTDAGGDIEALQLGPDGKLYVAHTAYLAPIGVIDFPNLAGAACNYSNSGQPVAPNYCQNGLPQFMTGYFKEIPPFTFTNSCLSASFTAFGNTSVATQTGCTAGSYSAALASWNFGDAASAQNTAQGYTSTHVFSAPGTYTVQLVLSATCTNDTIRQVVNIAQVPSFSITGASIICKGATASLSITGSSSNTYSWSTGATSTVISASPVTNTVYTVTATDPVSSCSFAQTFSIQVMPCTFINKQSVSGNMVVYPNPASEKLVLAMPAGLSGDDLLVQVLDITGHEVKRINLASGKSEQDLDIHELSDGVYLLQVRQGKALLLSSRFSKKQ